MKNKKMKVRIGLFAGTTEGRILSEKLSGTNADLDVFVATEYGKEGLSEAENIRVFCGRMTEEEIFARMIRETYELIVDATHPYARIVSENIRSACEKAGVPVLRVLREQETENGGILVSAVEEAVDFLKKTEGNILVTTGSKELAKFKELPDWENRIFARVLSLPQVVSDCAQMGFYGNHLIAMQGPFSTELNEALLRSTKSRWMVTKESGKAGGFEEKEEAAKRAGVGLVVIGRPKEDGMTLDAAWNFLKEMYGVEEKKTGAKRKLWLIGAGPGNPALLTVRAEKILSECQLIAGAGRITSRLKCFGKPVLEEYRPGEILKFLGEHPEYETAAAVFSGDTGFYSGAKKLLETCQEKKEFQVSVIPGISSLSYFFARTGKSWEHTKLISLHGRETNWLKAVKENEQVFILAGAGDLLSVICTGLLEAGLANVRITVGENLSLEEERIFEGSPKELKDRALAPLSVLLIENFHAAVGVDLLTHGLPDEAFFRGEVPMTKMEVRTVSVSRLGLTEGAVVYDVGAGTGSVSVECARLSDSVRVYAIERKPEALELLKKNRDRFGLSNMEIVEGTAPEAVRSLPAPTHVFIGGSGGKLSDILKLCLEKNPKARFVVNAITVESIAVLIEFLKHAPVKDAEYTTISAARSKKAGASHLMMGQNPVWIVSFTGDPLEKTEADHEG